ncbi:MAG: nuclear transport factor 2 family protein [Candidatus Marinimicrobia bacterium]|nr:nuclear transport factor 2 family protein [Candidatus Neomarinimicrobiota bacterium]MCK9559851.1 nuclear transport factor 2 family protein [Candidatus Neomarinimicrobiota bacterium]
MEDGIRTSRRYLIFILLTVSLLFKCEKERSLDRNSEYEAVKLAINNVIGWAVDKDFDLFFGTIADDSNFISVTPNERVKFGVADVKNDTAFWASPNFKAVRHEIHDLRINFSRDGKVAWYYCVLDDYNTWKGQPANWEKVRWTGVLEKRNGRWRVVQQHYSWPK